MHPALQLQREPGRVCMEQSSPPLGCPHLQGTRRLPALGAGPEHTGDISEGLSGLLAALNPSLWDWLSTGSPVKAPWHLQATLWSTPTTVHRGCSSRLVAKCCPQPFGQAQLHQWWALLPQRWHRHQWSTAMVAGCMDAVMKKGSPATSPQPGEENAAGRPCKILQVPREGLQKIWRGAFDTGP